jgi:hypothetical protein
VILDIIHSPVFIQKKSPPGRPRRMQADNIKTGLRKIGRDVVDWTHLTPDRGQWRALVNTVMNLWVPIKCLKLLSS